MIKVEIITPEKTIHSGTSDEVLVPTVDGILGIRTGHRPLITPLKPGVVVIKQDNGKSATFEIGSGFLEVQPDQVSIVTRKATA